MPIHTTEKEWGAPLVSVFFLIDTSASMCGQPIEAVNTAMREAIHEVQKFTQENADVAVRYSVLEFNTVARWMYESPSLIEDFKWVDLHASGITSLGEAYRMLDAKLSRNKGFLHEHANYTPIIVLLTDGCPTDDAETGLSLLKSNKWFKHSIKIGIELAPGADHSTLVAFTDSEESVIQTNSDELKRLLKIIAVDSATIGIQRRGKEFIENILNKAKDGDTAGLNSSCSSTSNSTDFDDPFEDIFD